MSSLKRLPVYVWVPIIGIGRPHEWLTIRFFEESCGSRAVSLAQSWFER